MHAKGKARQPYEFGVKVSIATTHKEGLVVGMRTMPGNPYDGHTLLETLQHQVTHSRVANSTASRVFNCCSQINWVSFCTQDLSLPLARFAIPWAMLQTSLAYG